MAIGGSKYSSGGDVEKFLVKIIISAGIILTLLAVTGGHDLVYSAFAAPSASPTLTLLSHDQNLDNLSTTYMNSQVYFQGPQVAINYLNETNNLSKHAYCYSCHGSTSSVFSSITNAENNQVIWLQGYMGLTIECAGCHTHGNVQ
jgi:hypothetical protein